MYEYRQLSKKQKEEVLAYRRLMRLPLHEPQHLPEGQNSYIISGACYEHKHLMNTDERRSYFQSRLLHALSSNPQIEIKAWVIMPNHYHVLLAVNLADLKPILARLYNGTATEWNREDGTKGRMVWHGFGDRRIRNERHYFATLNYIHSNPVKHGYVKYAQDWIWSSVHEYLDGYGREYLIKLWRDYPVLDYGNGWDDE